MRLLQPITIGNLQLNKRLVMALMTRSRAKGGGLISDLTMVYYVSEAVPV